ncbi:MAG: hypothetical protein OHK0019_00640 [Saprospiraceae bacterium]
MEQKKKTARKLIGMSVSEQQFNEFESLVVAIVQRDGDLVGKADVIKRGVDMVAMEVTGKAIFEQATAQI